MSIRWHIALLLAFSPSLLFGQSWLQRDTVFNPKRAAGVLGFEAAAFAGTSVGVYNLWYKQFELEPFHFFDDSQEWLQMDKLGHGHNAYNLGILGYEALKWSGVSENKSIWWGGTVGLWFMTSVEVMDGLSSGWGASVTDIIANTAGSSLFILQQKAWGVQKVKFRVSFHLSPYAQYRPETLGATFSERIMKDYNGQTYWLSASPGSFMEDSNWPEWLLLSVGYSADGMTGGSRNFKVNAAGDQIPSFARERQLLLSADLDLTKLNVGNQALQTLFKTIGWLKIPAPAVLFSTSGKVEFRPFYR